MLGKQRRRKQSGIRGRAALLIGFLSLTLAVAGTMRPDGTAAAAPPPEPPRGVDALIPRPTSWQEQGGTLRLDGRTRIHIDSAHRNTPVLPAGRSEFPGPISQTPIQLGRAWQAELTAITGLPIASGPSAPRVGPSDIVIRLVDDPALGAEGYRLDSSGPVTIEAATTSGAYYATRTLNQLLTTTQPDHRSIPRARSVDRPGKPVRMVQLDAGRKYWSMDYLKNLIRRMGQTKLNTLFLHLSDSEGFRLRSPEFPELAPDPAVSYSRAEIEELKRLGAEHHVQIMGGIDVPGHATVISQAYGIGFGSGPNACRPQDTHSHLTPDWIIDLTQDRAIDKSAAIVAEFASWFDAPLFSIGADELPGQLANCPRVREALARDPEVSSLGDLAVRYINRLNQEVRGTGKRTAIYNGVEHMASPRQDVDPSVVFLTWEGLGSEPEVEGHDEIVIGRFYNTPNNYHNLYSDPDWIYRDWQPSSAPDLLGAGMANWADYNFWADDQYFEQFMIHARPALADRSWNTSRPAADGAGLRERVAAIGEPVGLTPIPRPPRVGAAKPAHHWSFDQADYPRGWTWAGSPGNTIMVADTAGDLPGTSYIINNPQLIDDGVRGQAFRFDNPRDGVGFGGLDVAEPWSVSAWVRPAVAGGDQYLLTSRGGALKLSQGGTGKVGISSPGLGDLSFDYTVPTGRWTQLSWVTEPGSTTLYANGRRVGRILASMPLPMRSIGVPNGSLFGDLDEVSTWDAALSPEQVRADFAQYGIADTEPDYQPTVASLNSHQTPQWFNDDKFGIFIHWGPYSVPAWGPRGSYAEWYDRYLNDRGSATWNHHRDTYGQDYDYDRFLSEWKAEKFDPDDWTQLFHDAGAKYFVLTSKHHDGGALFDSKVSGRDTVDLGPRRDLAKDLFTSARNRGDLRAGFYYSLYEWFNPNYTGRPATNPYTGKEIDYTGIKKVDSYVNDYMHPQMRELIDNYDPDIMWCDGQWDESAAYWNTAPVLADYYNQAKNRPNPKQVAVANRCKIESGSLGSHELDFQTPEYSVKPDIDPVKWESSRGIAHSYGYNANEPIEDYLSSDQLVDSLVDIVSKNGNLLLNIGPKADGTVPELQRQRLLDIGAWLKINGEAIYGTSYYNRAEEPASSTPIRYTEKDGALYATALAWPGAELKLGGDLPFVEGTQVTLLGSDGGTLPWRRNADGTITISTPPAGAEATRSEHAYTFKIATPGVTALPRVQVEAPTEVAPGSTAHASFTVRNPGTAPMAGATARIRVLGGGTPTPSQVDLGTIGAGESVTVPITVAVPPGVTGTQTIIVDVTAAGVTGSGRAAIGIELPLLSEGRPASQVSTAWGAPAGRAVDGNRNGDFGGGSVTHTAEPSNQAWWQVDLEAIRQLSRVDVYNRTDCCSQRLSNYWVLASDQPMTGTLEQLRNDPAVTAVRVAEIAGSPSRIELPPGTHGRYLRIQLESATDPLSLAEVQVRGSG